MGAVSITMFECEVCGHLVKTEKAYTSHMKGHEKAIVRVARRSEFTRQVEAAKAESKTVGEFADALERMYAAQKVREEAAEVASTMYKEMMKVKNKLLDEACEELDFHRISEELWVEKGLLKEMQG